MNTKTLTNNIQLPGRIILLAVALIIAAGLAGYNHTLGLNDRTAFIILFAAGMALCLTGMKIETYGWMNPFNLAGSILGAGILLFVAAVFMGIQLPWISGDRDAFTILSILIVLKIIVSRLRGFSGASQK